MQAFGLAMLMLLIAALGTAARADVCRQSGAAPVVEVTLDLGQVRYDHSRDGPALAALFRERGSAVAGQGHRPLGLTISELDLQIRTRVAAVRQSGRWCVRLHKAEVRLRLARLDVLIDRRYAKGSCQYQAILDHEQAHVRIIRQAVEAGFGSLKAKAAETAAADVLLSANSEEAARQAHARLLQRQLLTAVRAIDRQAAVRHAELDSHASYHRTMNRCASW